MKKKLGLLLILILMICLTGCVKYNVSMEVKDDKSVTLEIIYGMEVDDSFMDDEEPWDEEDSWYDEEESWDDEDSWYDEEESLDEEESDSEVSVDDYKFLESKGFKVEEFIEEKDDTVISGVKITKTYENIDDITKDKEIVVDFNETFGDEDNFDDSQIFYKKGNNYVANFVFDFSEEGDDTDYSEYQSMFDLQYKIKLPKKVVSSNATYLSDDGKELTWDLKYGVKNKVNFQFSFEDNNLEKSQIMLFVVFGICSAIVIGCIVIIAVTPSKKQNQQRTTMKIKI